MDVAALRELASRYSVATDFWDWQGQHTEIQPTTLISVLQALGVPAATDAEVANSIQMADQRHWQDTLPPTIVTRAGWTPWVAVHLPHGREAGLELRLEDGSRRSIAQIENWVDPRELAGQLIGEATFELPGDLPLGWHRAIATIDGIPAAEATLIVTPHRLDLPDWLEQPVWGLMEQIYQVRSTHSWGLGDFTDLAGIMAWAGGEGADFCLVNPIHAGSLRAPMEPSPYLPTSRLFTNPIYLDVERVPGYDAVPDAAKEAARNAAQLPSPEQTLDRDRVWAAKERVLAEIFGSTGAGQDPDFRAFCERSGEALLDFATWNVLDEQGLLAQSEGSDLSTPGSPGLAGFRERHSDRIDFHCWLQWLTRQQHENVQSAALASGMRIGLINDLAVGVHPSGADAWSMQDCLATSVHVGAPPDQFNQLGQNWHQPPWHPGRLAELGYAPYRDLVRAALHNCGALRIDHIIGLFRLWLIPNDRSPDQGTYVYYDHEALVGILLLEAHRAGVIVIGEDLGVVEPSARAHLAERGILGTSILWFEWHDGQPLPPEDYRQLCLSSVTTHDLPPTAGYLDLIQVRIRDELGLLTRSVEQELTAEQHTLAQVRRALTDRGLCQEGASTDELVLALHQWLRATPSLLQGVAVADLVGDVRPINQPGTKAEYPNWRLPLTDSSGQEVLLEQVIGSARVRQPGRTIKNRTGTR